MGLFLDIYIEFFFRAAIRSFRKLRAKSWPLLKAKITATSCSPAGFGCAIAEVSYRYIFSGEPYTGIDAKPFVWTDSAESYIERCDVGSELYIRVNAGKPDVSVVSERPR
jgi:hypothetical protein